ncbi:MAG: prenyltransferase [Planctomycetes bacterium]|nr:prenyltransferase [Planctomycetota bacterium]
MDPSRPGVRPIIMVRSVPSSHAWVLLAALATVAGPAFPQEGGGPGRGEPPGGADTELSTASREAVRAGHAFLASTQAEDGGWSEIVGRKVNDQYLGFYARHVGVTSLAAISYMAGGSLPGRGPYGPQVEHALAYVLDQVREDGFISANESRMYSHAFATLFLAEVYGMTGRMDIQRPLRRAVDMIVVAQNEQGGWRYLPTAKDSDISITVCQVQALRAARNAGVYVPAASIEAAIRYVKASFIDTEYDPTRKNGFWYQVFENMDYRPSRTSFALTGAGVTALYGAGEYDSREIRGGLQFLDNPRNHPHPSEMHRTFDYYYGHYYASQAMFQAGGRYWRRYWPRLRDDIVSGQRPDGSWKDLVGPHYATAMATLILQIPYRYLPILDR